MELPSGRTLLNIFQVSVVVLIPVGVFIAVKMGRRSDLKRHEALTGVAAQLGLTYTSEDNTLLREFGGFPFAPRGDLPRIYSLMRGVIPGGPAALFDYDVTIGSANNRTVLRRTVAAFDVGAGTFPEFYLEGGRQEKITRLLDKLFGENGIEFHDDPDFARAYNVYATDADAVRRALSGPVRAFLLKRPEWKCRSVGRWFLMSWMKDRPEPAGYAAFIKETSEGMAVFRSSVS